MSSSASRDEKRHKYAALMLSHRQEWQRYAHNQTKRAINKDKSVVRVAFASTSSSEKAMKKIEAYHKGPSIKVWENVFKSVWLETGHAAAEFMHEYLTGKSANVTADIVNENNQGLKTFVWKDPLVDTVLSSWDSRVDDKVMNGGFLDKIEGINSTTQDNIHRTIQEGVANGDSHYTIGQNIESHLDETWAKRGETISRTETNSAMNAATREDMKATAPDLWKTWSIAGNNTRPWHEEVDGESIPQDEMFIVDGEEMSGPGDDSASPSNVVNCECTQLAEEPPAGTPVSDEEQARIDEAALAQEGATSEEAAAERQGERYTDYKESTDAFTTWAESDAITDSDAGLITDYTTTDFVTINRYWTAPDEWAELVVDDPARLMNVEGMSPKEVLEYQQLQRDRAEMQALRLSKLTDMAPQFKGTVYRGVNTSNDELVDYLVNYKEHGQTLTLDGMQSTSVNKGVIDKITEIMPGGESRTKIAYTIKDSHGASIEPLSGVKDRLNLDEVLLNTGHEYKIESVETKSYFAGKPGAEIGTPLQPKEMEVLLRMIK